MFRVVLFILVSLIFIERNSLRFPLLGAEFGRPKRIAGHFSLEKHSVCSGFSAEGSSAGSGFSDLSYSVPYQDFPQALPAVYDQGYYRSDPFSEEFWSSAPSAYYQGYYNPDPPIDEDFGNQWPDPPYWGYDGYYSYPEPNPFSGTAASYYSDGLSIDDPRLQDEMENGYGENLTYKSFGLDENPLFKEIQLGWRDVQHLYTCSNAGNYGVILGLAAVLANTSLDQQFADWYQENVRSSSTDDFASFWKDFGEGRYFYPLFVGGAVLGDLLAASLPEDSLWNQSSAGEYLSRTARAEVIAVPVLLLGRAVLGAGRPCNGEGSSRWSRPFTKECESGISGHAYVGSIPFITLAQMSDSYCCKGIFYAASAFPCLSRINDNHHYLSQVILGWYLGYLSCRAVTETETGPLSCGLTFFPLVTEESSQIGFSYSY